MDEKTRQRIWISAVVVLGVTVCVQYLNNRDLRSEVARLRISPEQNCSSGWIGAPRS